MISNRPTSKKATRFAWAILALAFIPLPARPAPYDHSLTIGPAKGWLMIHGGGPVPPEEGPSFSWQAASAGRGPIPQ